MLRWVYRARAARAALNWIDEYADLTGCGLTRPGLWKGGGVAGEGGMIVTSDPVIAEEARIYRDQGKGSFSANHHVRHGYAWRMSEFSAAAGEIHLRRMTDFIRRRREVAARYDAGLSSRGFLRPLGEPAGCMSNFYKYVALLPAGVERAWFKEQMATRHDVRLAGEVYDVPAHRQPVLAPYAPGLRLPAAEEVCRRHVCLPVHSDMTDDEADQVLDAVAKVADDSPAAPEDTACAWR